jgi:methionyl-tRNA formyltransferase
MAGEENDASAPNAAKAAVMRIVFCGTPAFAVPSLQNLLRQPDFAILAVLTQPDRPRGRGQDVAESAVKQAAAAAGIAVHQPEKVRAPDVQQLLERLAPDAVVIIAYGQIIPARLLPIPKHGWINLHASLLPKYRGAAPINWAIANGEARTGITSMRIDAGMDTGDMLLHREIEIGLSETAPELSARLAELGAPLIVETLRGLAADMIRPEPQDHAAATYAPILKREDGRIDWRLPAEQIYNRMRGFKPWPGAHTTFRGQLCHLFGEPVSKTKREKTVAGSPGTLAHTSGAAWVACGDSTVLRLTSVKLEGRKQMSASEFAIGARLQPGERFA